MAISFDCFMDALDPFLPRVEDLIFPVPLIEEWLNPKRLLAKAAASRFHLGPEEFSIFDLWWELSSPARHLMKRDLATGLGVEGEMFEAFTRLAKIVNAGAEYTERGYRHVRRMSGNGRFVIFSDHHMAVAGSRQDFFFTSGNSELYSKILTEYANTGFTLIENGDVEELIIHEPMQPPPQLQLVLQDLVQDTTDPEDSAWNALDESRTLGRLFQLTQVIENYKDLYKQINKQFVDQGRYIRIAGNHDQDNQDPRFLEMLRTKYPNLEQVYDFLILEPADVNGPTFVVGHGHHFDKASTPKYSKRIGETLSECLAWAYEGADRVWRWDRRDGVKDWANGEEAFLNTLVTDDPDPNKFTFGDKVEAGLAPFLSAAVGNLAGLIIGLGGVAGMAASLADELSDPAFWEETYGHNIAWEYFRSSDSGEAVFNELFCGQRWNKFRHLDEVFINQQLESKFESFGAKVPYLVLGHSHEPRHRAVNPAGPDGVASIAAHYLNSGAAGRFQNLIWCVEIIDGVPQVVAWHRPGGPESVEAPERRTYTPARSEVKPSVGLLIPSDRHVSLPPVEEEKTSWLEAVLHVMMSQP